MTIAHRLIALVVSTAAVLGSASPSHAQFSFNVGGFQVGGGQSGGNWSGYNNVVQQFQRAVEPTWNGPTDMRYRGDRGSTTQQIIETVAQLAIDAPRVGGSNPYCQPQPVCPPITCPDPVINPAPVDPVPAPPEEVDGGLQLTYQAQEAFRRGDYAQATAIMNEVIQATPESSAAYQFRALTYFAQGDYDRGAADVYDTLLRGPIWNWETVYPLYNDVDIYTGHYRALSRSAKQDTNSMSKHFLLAYHHLMLGHLEHGEKALKQVLKIQPQEVVTQKLLGVVQNLRNGNAQKVATR